MVRKRGVARTSFARRRVRRVKKYDHHVIPLRFKVQLLDFVERLEPKLYVHVECEVPTMELLQSLGVPTEEWVYYLGFMKRMVKLYRNFTSETLQKEKDSLISEYVLRGKDKDVLEQVQEVAANCARGIFELPLNCDEVKACLEGDYSSWTYQWTLVVTNWLRGWGHILRVDETNNFIQFIAHEDYYLLKVNLTTGALISETDVLQYYSSGVSNRSLLGKYVAYVLNDGGVPKLKIEKDGALIQTIDLSQAPISWSSTGTDYHVAVSTDGKYILVYNDDEVEYVLFKGS